MEVLIVSDFIILHLIELVERRFAQWPLNLRHKLILVIHDLEEHLFDIFFYCKKVSFDTLLLKEFDLLLNRTASTIPVLSWPCHQVRYLLRNLLEQL
jgi:hypothetical protein